MLDLLSKISQSSTVESGLKNQYKDLVRHERPNAYVPAKIIETKSFIDGVSADYRMVVTEGMTYVYYDVVDYNGYNGEDEEDRNGSDDEDSD